MKKYICRLLVLAVMVLVVCVEAFADVEINEANFPDVAFRRYVRSQFNNYNTLSDSEISSAKKLM